MLKKTAAFSLVLLLMASVAVAGERKTWVGHVRYHTARTLKALGSELSSMMGTMRRNIADLKEGAAKSVTDLTAAGRRGVGSVQKATSFAFRTAYRETRGTLTSVARQAVPVGTAPISRAPEVARPIDSPILAAHFLRSQDILVAWHLDTGDQPMRRSLVLDDRLLLETKGFDVYCFNPQTGILQWLYALPGASQGEYTSDENLIFVVAVDTLFEIDRVIGRPRSRLVLQFPTSCPPTILGNTALLTSWERRVYAVNRDTRVKEWSFVPDDAVVGAVAAVPTMLYCGDVSGHLNAYSPVERRTRWTYNARDAIRVSLVLDGDDLIFPAEDLSVHCVNRFGGRCRWKFAIQGFVRQPVWVDGNVVYFSADDDAFYAVSRDKGDLLWRVPKGGWPVAVGNLNIYLQGPNREVWAVDRKTGEKRWAVSAEPFTYFVRNTTNDHIYLCADTGEVYALYLRGDHVEKKAPPEEKLGPPEPKAPGVEEPEAAPKLP